MTPLLLLTIYCLLIMIASLTGGWVTVWLRLTHKRLEVMVSLVAGFMLGVALLHLLPEAAHKAATLKAVMPPLLIGFLAMFFIERFFCFHHHDAPQTELGSQRDHEIAPRYALGNHSHQLRWTGAAIGLTLHSIIAGAGLAVSVRAESHECIPWPGLAMFLVIVLHKPFDALTLGTLMTMGDWSVGWRHMANILFAFAVPAAAALVFLGITSNLPSDTHWVGTLLAFVTGTILCIATSDLLPELQFHQHDRMKLSLALVGGLVLAWLVGQFHMHDDSPHEHTLHSPMPAASQIHDHSE